MIMSRYTTIILAIYSFFSFAQMSGPSITSGTGWWKQIDGEYSNKGSKHIGLGYELLLTRNLNTKLNMRMQSFPVSERNEDITLNRNEVNAFEIGIDMNYWYLNDLRLINTTFRQSCKGMAVVLATKFKSYLIGGITYRTILSTEPYMNNNHLLFNYGLGIQFWRFSLQANNRFLKPTNRSNNGLIPFIEFRGNNAINATLLDNESYRHSGFMLSFGIKYSMF
jgi:hypothetical protein